MNPEIAHAGTTGANERAVLRPDDRLVRGTTLGMNEPFDVAEGTRQPMLNIPVGVPALYLLNKAKIIIDATLGDERALLQTLAQWSKDRQRMIRP